MNLTNWMMLRRSILFAAIVVGAGAYNHDAFYHEQGGTQLALGDTTKRVAVIGAGAGGASTAYHLRKFTDEAGIQANITLFERNDYIGGRSITVQAYDDPNSEPIELGASIFVEVNHILVNATKHFNLNTLNLEEDFKHKIADPDARAKKADAPLLGIWNGREFILTQSAKNRWWDIAKLLWRYGLAPIKTNNLMKSVVGKFLQMYEEPLFPWTSLGQAAYDLGLTAVTAATGAQYLKENDVNDLFANEVVQASTRVNYAQNLGKIHGLEALVCMATDGAMAVEGGNWQIFDNMAQRATNDVRLKADVSSVERQEDGSYIIHTKHINEGAEHTSSEQFDTVILAAPLQFSGIGLSPEPKHVPDEIPYVKLHVTLFTSPHLLSPAAFGLPIDSSVPEIILTTLQPDETPGDGPSGVGKAGFFSISLLRPIVNPNNLRQEFAYKIFSPQVVDAAFLSHILGVANSSDDELDVGKGDVSWVYRKVWHSYPYEHPRVTFDPLRLDTDLWYTSGIESFISTMETSALMGKNIARLIVDGWAEVLRDTRWSSGRYFQQPIKPN